MQPFRHLSSRRRILWLAESQFSREVFMASWLKLLLSANASEVTIVQQNPLRLEFRGRSDMLVKAQMQKVTVRTLFSGCDRGKYFCRWVGNSSTLLRPNFAWASAGSVASPRPALRRFFL